TYFDINDFDEAALAPVTLDLARLVTRLPLAAVTLQFDAALRGALEDAYLAGYGDLLVAGKARWIERAVATGLIGELLTKVGERKRPEFIKSRTERQGNSRALRLIEGKTL